MSTWEIIQAVARPLPARRRSAAAQVAATAVAPEAKWAALVAIVLAIAAGSYLTLHLQYTSFDAVSRVSHAYYVLFSRDPHLAAIGFVWTPLSSILCLPLVAFYPLWPALVNLGFAGVFISALFSGLAAFSLSRLLARFGLPLGWRWIAVGAFLLNPLILLYSANGMTDVMLVATILATYDHLCAYFSDGKVARLWSASLWTVVGFGVRYEAIPFAVFLGLAIAFAVAARSNWRRAEGAALLYLAPVAYAGALWLYFSWLIMKSPLYFLDGNYSNVAQTSLSAYEVSIQRHVMHQPLHVIAYVAHFTLLYFPFDLALVALLPFLWGRRLDPRALILIFGSFGILTLDMALLYKGNLAPWDRYFIYYIPNGIALTALATAHLLKRAGTRLRRGLVLAASATLLLAGSAGTAWALSTPSLGDPDGTVIRRALENRPTPMLNQEALALRHYINSHPHLTILTDEFISGVPVVIQAHNLKQFVITPDQDFKSILTNPRGRVDAILVPQPVGGAKLDAVNEQWPGMWYGKLPWAHLIRQFPNVDGVTYRLFAVGSNAP